MLEITETNLDAMIREYQALTFSNLYRKLSEKDAARMQEIEEALERISLEEPN